MSAAFQSTAFQASGFQTVSVTPPPKPPRPGGGGRPWWFPELEGQWTDDSYNRILMERRKRKQAEAVFIFKP